MCSDQPFEKFFSQNNSGLKVFTLDDTQLSAKNFL